jgi:DNA-binding transcriptional MerR regulator
VEKFTDVDYEEIQEDVYYTAVQVASIIGVDVSVIRSWTKPDAFENELDIKRVNGRRVFTKQDIENIKFIKDLRDKKYPVKQIKEVIAKKGFKYAEYDSGLIDPKDPFGFDALSIKITEENKKQLKIFIQELINENNKLINTVDNKVNRIEEIALDQEESMKNIQKELQEQKEENRKLSIQLVDIKNSMDENNRLAEMSNNLRQKELERKKESEEPPQQQIGFFGKLFGKKK